jgi:hypothetical protein
MLSRIIRRPVQTIARRNMSLQTALGGTKQDIAACQKKMQMDLRYTFLRGGKKDDMALSFAVVLALGIVVGVGRGMYKMARGEKD